MNKQTLTKIIADFFDIHCEDCFVKEIIDMDTIRDLVESIIERLEEDEE